MTYRLSMVLLHFVWCVLPSARLASLVASNTSFTNSSASITNNKILKNNGPLTIINNFNNLVSGMFKMLREIISIQYKFILYCCFLFLLLRLSVMIALRRKLQSLQSLESIVSSPRPPDKSVTRLKHSSPNNEKKTTHVGGLGTRLSFVLIDPLTLVIDRDWPI